MGEDASVRITIPLRVSTVTVTSAGRESVNEAVRALGSPAFRRATSGLTASDESVLLSAKSRAALDRRPWSSVAVTVNVYVPSGRAAPPPAPPVNENA